MKDEDWITMDQGQRAFMMRWFGLNEVEREQFLRNLLSAIEALERLGVLDPPRTDAAA